MKEQTKWKTKYPRGKNPAELSFTLLNWGDNLARSLVHSNNTAENVPSVSSNETSRWRLITRLLSETTEERQWSIENRP